MEALDRVRAGWCERWRAASTELGQVLAEYSLIVTIIGVGTVLLALIVFRTSLAGAFSAVTGCFDGSC